MNDRLTCVRAAAHATAVYATGTAHSRGRQRLVAALTIDVNGDAGSPTHPARVWNRSTRAATAVSIRGRANSTAARTVHGIDCAKAAVAP